MPELLNNRYSVLQTLGRGGCGETFLAEDTYMPSKRRCVIKQLKPVASNLASYQTIKERFEREAAILEMIGRECEQIPKLQAYFTENREFYLVQDWVEGKNLEEAVKEDGPFMETTVREFLISILSVLDFIHARGIIHRDIKPANIMLRKYDRKPLLIDFGAVKEIVTTEVDLHGHLASTIVIGSPDFMPPEQALGQPVFASDLYSLGLTAIFLLTGKTLTEWNRSPGGSWRTFAPHISDNLAAILDKVTDPVASNRYAYAREMLNALRLRDTILADFPPAYPAHRGQKQNQGGEARTRRWLLVLITVPLLLVLAGVGSFALYKYFEWKMTEAEQRAQRETQQRAERESQTKIDEERARREEAEQRSQNAEDRAKAAEETAALERAKRQGNAYYVVQIGNHTQLDLYYQILNSNGSWLNTKIEAGKTMWHWRKRGIVIKFDFDLSDKYQEKRYDLDSTAVIGEPTESEKSSAELYYFDTKGTDKIDLYKEP